MKKLLSILVLSLSFTSLKAADVCYYTDWEALQDFYTATNGDNWTDTTGWTFIKNAVGSGFNNSLECPAVDPQGITSFISDNFTLNGTSVELRSVSELNLSNNNLTGMLPSSIGDLSLLEILKLNTNGITGNIPTELGDLDLLKRLSLFNNQLSGSIPPSLGDLSSLETLFLDNNQLSGSMPSSLGDLNSLEVLSLTNNNLTGQIPNEFLDLSSLEKMYLGNNNLTGSIPYSLGNLNALEVLSLHDNQLTGDIPYSLGQSSAFTKLYLYNNDLGGCYAPSLTSLCTQLTSNLTDVSNGNPKLLSTFSDFCSSGKGSCQPCDGDLNLVSTADDYARGVGHFYSQNSVSDSYDIIASNKLTDDANITYSAGGAVLLESGFSVDNGAVFLAEIGGCTGK